MVERDSSVNLLACSRHMEYNRQCSKHSHLLVPQATYRSKSSIMTMKACLVHAGSSFCTYVYEQGSE